MPNDVKRRKVKKTASVYIMRRVTAILLFFAIVAGVVLSLTVFFNIENVEVKGALEIYTKQEIANISGIRKGSNIFRFSAYNAKNRILRELPYISDVIIKRVLPSTVVITVKEAPNALVVVCSGGSLIISQDMKILNEAAANPSKSLMIYGIEPVSRKTGAVLASENESAVSILQTLIGQLNELELLADASAVNTSDRLDICLLMKGRVLVRFGTSGDIERKCLMLAEMMNNQLEDGDMGILDLSVSGKATFAPRDDAELAVKLNETIYKRAQ